MGCLETKIKVRKSLSQKEMEVWYLEMKTEVQNELRAWRMRTRQNKTIHLNLWHDHTLEMELKGLEGTACKEFLVIWELMRVVQWKCILELHPTEHFEDIMVTAVLATAVLTTVDNRQSEQDLERQHTDERKGGREEDLPHRQYLVLAKSS